MTTLDHHASTTRSTLRVNVIGRGLQALLGVCRALKNRREFYRLGEFTDVELADIGLTRADLHVALSPPFAGDPTASLETIVRRRMADERAARSVC